MNCIGSFCITVGFFWFYLDHCDSLWVTVNFTLDRCGSLWIILGHYRRWWVVVDRFGSFLVLVSTISFLPLPLKPKSIPLFLTSQQIDYDWTFNDWRLLLWMSKPLLSDILEWSFKLLFLSQEKLFALDLYKKQVSKLWLSSLTISTNKHLVFGIVLY